MPDYVQNNYMYTQMNKYNYKTKKDRFRYKIRGVDG